MPSGRLTRKKGTPPQSSALLQSGAEFNMITRIWHGATQAAKSDEYLNLMRTVAIPDYRSIPGNKGAYALRRIEGDTAHFLMVTLWESEEAIRAFAGDDIRVAKYYDFDQDFLLELEPCSTHYEMYDQ
jgi:heme-degrading monooxygenase HmoA